MPTLIACTVGGLALVILVGLQAPAVSAGMRWKPEPRKRLQLPRIEIDREFEFEWALKAADGMPPWVIWTLGTLVVLAILVGFARLIPYLRRRWPTMNVARMGAESRAPSEADARIVQSGLTAAFHILTAEGERDPANAVVKAWQGLQDAAASGGLHRRPAETATEFTARILYRSRRSAEPITLLLALYQRVRFGEHTPSADDIVAAQHALAILVELWRADFPERRPKRAAR